MASPFPDASTIVSTQHNEHLEDMETGDALLTTDLQHP
jgi:hypothetical protein